MQLPEFVNNTMSASHVTVQFALRC